MLGAVSPAHYTTHHREILLNLLYQPLLTDDILVLVHRFQNPRVVWEMGLLIQFALNDLMPSHPYFL